MYNPKQFEETRVPVLHAMIQANPLGLLITQRSDGLGAEHIPFLIDAQDGANGTLRGHVARANSVWNDSILDVPALVVFQGPSAYISPGFYPTKKLNGMVVPTFNYVVVHARGPLRVIDDARWLHTLVSRLTNRFEAARAEPWAVTDAPDGFISAQLKAIVGIEIPLHALEGKWKVSQNRNAADKLGVVQGLREDASLQSLAMADVVSLRGSELKARSS